MAQAALPIMAAVGTGLQIYGQIKADKAQEKQDTENALFLQKQAKEAQLAGVREQEIADDQYANTLGNQVSGFARGGVDVGSGSPLLVLAQTRLNQSKEDVAIQNDTQLKFDLANSRANSTLQNVSDLKSSAPWRYASTILTGATQIAGTVSKSASSFAGAAGA